MLGPSGSGKTTVLRLIAGFEKPTAGTIELFGEDVTDKAPFDRDVNTVFQDYALFPHMTCSTTSRTVCASGAWPARSAARSLRRRWTRFGWRVRVPQAEPALRRPAPAGRAGPRDRRAAEGAAARRAAGRARPQAPRGDAGRAQGDPARPRHHLHLRHARSGGGAHPQRPHRRVQRRQDRAARHPERDLRAAGIAVRRRLRRHVEPVRRRGIHGAARPRRRTTRSAPRRSPSATRSPARRARVSVVGEIAEEIYVGTRTRVLVDIDAGLRLNVLEQNAARRTDHDRGGARGGRMARPRRGRPHRTCRASNRATHRERKTSNETNHTRRGRVQRPRPGVRSSALLTACGTAGGGGGGEPRRRARRVRRRGLDPRVARLRRGRQQRPRRRLGVRLRGGDRLRGHVKTFGTSDEALNLMKTGEYDVVAASGDASLRLVAAGDVVEVNTDLLPNYEGIFDFLKNQSWNSVDGVPTACRTATAPTCSCTTPTSSPRLPPRGTSCSTARAAYTGKVTAYDSRSTSRMPRCTSWRTTRTSASRTRTRSTGPARGGGRPAQGAARAHRRVLERLPQGDPGVRDR